MVETDRRIHNASSWTDDAVKNGRTLSRKFVANDMTVAKCYRIAVANQFAYFGLEYGMTGITAMLATCIEGTYSYADARTGNECWCGNTLNPKSAASPVGDTKTCKQSCAGNARQLCGGPSRMNLYRVASTVSTASSTSSRTSTTTASQSTGTSGSSQAVPVDLNRANCTNAQVTTSNGQTVINMSPPAGGSATVELPPNSLTPPSQGQGSQCTVSVTYQASLPQVVKRGQPTQCTLTMYLGGQLIYQAPIVTTGQTSRTSVSGQISVLKSR
jgi:hypothetical protein